MSTVQISTRDRFNFALFVAVSAHLLLILGVGFSSEQNLPESVSIDVTLALANDEVAPEQADFIAATNQQGSGTESEIMEMTTTRDADFHTNEFREVVSLPEPTPAAPEQTAQLLTTDAPADTAANAELKELTELLEAQPTTSFDRRRLIEEIASLEARIAEDKQALANMPRTKRINSASTRPASEAAYLNAWREKCERIGAINYPSGHLEGEALILVSILANGTLEEVRILKSSGHRALDQAALATIRQAAPFQPFNVDMRKAYDRLEFTRWWQFNRIRSSAQS